MDEQRVKRAQVARLHRLAAQAGVFLRIDHTLPDHCPGRITRREGQTLVRVAYGLTPAERLAYLRTALGTTAATR
ncbi:hypothetical protein ACFWA1_35860 [Streptomyces sp. NPDC060005]|uniref:hypothetical protein n=1 Tax=Streptomyces sp. NPDC060005 TaxID=3347034 RepID=UPI003680E1E4